MAKTMEMAKTKVIKKRDGRVVPFDQEKITNAIFKAAQSVGGKDRELAKKLSDEIVSILEKRHKEEVFGVEEVQDVVEKVLIEGGHARTAKSYILYREKHKKLREVRAAIGVHDDLKLSINALKVLEQRYLKRDRNRKVTETPSGLFRRVSHNIAEADVSYGKSEDDVRITEEEFYGMMTRLEFMPNSPTLMNAGKELQQLSACFVLPVPDSMDGIFDSLKCAALVHQSGGGTGFSFTELRPKGDIVKSTGGIASGPVTFMRVFNTATDVIKQGGTRRGANMGILRVDHPDILEFITAKEKEGQIDNFNISVVVTSDFMEAVKKGGDYDLINPRTGKVVGKLNARSVFDLMVTMAWKNGEPGIIFIDKINKDNPTPNIGKIMATNPCIAGDSLVSTENGLERMEELVERENVSLCVDNRLVCLNLATSGGTAMAKGKGTSFSKATRAWKSGRKKAMKLTTKSGFELTATPDHRIMTTEGWIPLGDLKAGRDKVLLQGAINKLSKNNRWDKRAKKIEKLLEKAYHSGRFEDVVAEVSDQGMTDVYDLTEPLTHSFIANGIVVSNCGEQPLLPYEACNLGSINLNKMLKEKDGKYEIDYEKLKETIHKSVHFLDNVIDMGKFPIDKIREMVHGNRKIGLGIMGWADVLISLGMPYNGEEATKLAGKVMSFIHEESVKASQKLAEERGIFPNWKGSAWEKKGIKVRHATLNTIAPTGTISIIAGCSSGIEPLFAISYIRRIMDGMELIEMNPSFEKMARKRGFYNVNLIKKITRKGTIQHIDEIPDDMKKVFVTAHDIQPEWHVKMQAAFQKHTDNAVSKTINFPADATIDDVRKAYMLCNELGCKGMTVYRDRSREKQVLNIEEIKENSNEKSDEPKESGKEDPAVRVSSEYAGGCPTCSI